MEFKIGNKVRLKTDTERTARMITGILLRPNSILYYVSLVNQETIHYGIELIKIDKKEIKPLGYISFNQQ